MSYPSDGHPPRAYPGDGAPRDLQRRRQPQGYQPRGAYQPQDGHPPGGPSSPGGGYQRDSRQRGYDDYAPGYRDQGQGGYGQPDGYGRRGPQGGGGYDPRGGGYADPGNYGAQGNHGAQGGYGVNDGYGGHGHNGHGSGGGYGSGGVYGSPGGGWGDREPATQVIDTYPGHDYGLPDPDADETAGGGKRRLKTKKDKRARRKKIRKILLICLSVFVVLIAGGTVAGWQYLRSVEDKVTKVDAFDQIPESERPAQVSTKAMNILILGSDSRDPDVAGSRTDTIMIAHVTQDHKTSQIVSIPRDSWVDIPKSADGRHGGAKGKINWAFSWGGIPLMVRTVESVTKVRVDHVILIDFAGFQQVVDAVGGIDIQNDVTFTSYFGENNHHVFEKGKLHLDGNLALDFARQRKMLAGGDFDRIKNQQKVVKGVLDKATSRGVIADPGKLTAFLTSVAKTITTDKSFDLLSTAMALRGISSSQVKFMTAPTKGTGKVGDQSVVLYDFDNAASLWEALKNDQAATWTKPKA